jgi:cytochrome b561
MAPVWNSIATPVSYSASAKVMHWFVAAAVIVLLALGPVMKRLVPEGSLRDNLYNFHEALGALVLIVMVVRLVRRLAFGVPAPDASMPIVEQRASLWAQYALYVLLFVTTVLGWAGTNAYGDPVSVFGLQLSDHHRQGSTAVRRHYLLASHLRDSDRRDRHTPYRGRALPPARQRRRRFTAHAAGELSVARRARALCSFGD